MFGFQCSVAWLSEPGCCSFLLVISGLRACVQQTALARFGEPSDVLVIDHELLRIDQRPDEVAQAVGDGFGFT